MTDFFLETERLILRNWKDEDRDLFHFINSDDTVMEFFPFRRDRQQSDELMDRLRSDIHQNGFGFTAIEEKASGECVGFCGLHRCDLGTLFPEGTIEIGWRLAPQFWGKGYVTETALRLLKFGFEELKFSEIVSFAVESNDKSFAVMNRIGLKRDGSRDFDLPKITDEHQHLRPHLVYDIQRNDYR